MFPSVLLITFSTLFHFIGVNTQLAYLRYVAINTQLGKIPLPRHWCLTLVAMTTDDAAVVIALSKCVQYARSSRTISINLLKVAVCATLWIFFF